MKRVLLLLLIYSLYNWNILPNPVIPNFSFDGSYNKLDSYVSFKSGFDFNFNNVYESRNITSCPTSFSVNVDPGTCGAVVTFTLPTTDVAGGSMVLTSALGYGDTFPVGITTVTFEERDAGNVVTGNICSFDVTVNDTENPTITCPGDITVSNDPGQCDAVVTWTAPTGNDNCSGSVVTSSHNPGDTFPIGTTTVTYTITDAASNTASCSFDVTVNDTENPTITCTSDIVVTNETGLCTAIVNYTTPTATDNCSSSILITQTAGLPSGSAFPVGVTTNTFEANDGNGNTSTCSFTVTVNDNEVPTINCPSDITVNADSNCEVTSLALGTPTTNDNCGIASITNNAPTTFPLGNTTITWTVTDNAGLIATCTQTVTVQDVTPPSITCPTPNASYNTDAGECDTTLSFTATATDNCSGAPIVTYEVGGNPITFPYDFPVGTTTVDVFADDGNGQTATCNFTVNVQDNEAPTVICQPLTVTLDAAGTASIAENAIDNGSTDACGGLTFDTNITSFDCSDIGVNPVTLTVTDANGNSATCSTTVIVQDFVQNATATINVSPSTTICQGDSVTFTASGTNLGANPQYEWFVNSLSVGNNSATYTTTALNNNDDVYVEITSGPCNTSTVSNTIVMTVNPLLPVSFILNASANPACSGDNLTFFVTGLINGGSNPTYQWYVNSNPVGGNTNSYTSNSIIDGDIISVDVSSNLACADPVPASQSLTMTVTPDATITLTSANDNQTVCNGTAMTDIVYTITNATNATVTGIPAGVTGTYNSGTFTISGTPTQIGTFNYTITPVGCGNSVATGTITVGPDATITLISPSEDTSVCNDGTPMTPIEFQLNSGASGATLTSTPALPAGITGNYNSGTGVYSISGSSTQPGIYDYTVTTNGCGSGYSISGTIIVNNGIPVLPTTITGPSSFICPIAEAIYSVPDDPNVDYYTWTVSGGFTIQSGQGTNEVTLDVNGFALFETITVTATNACGTSSSISRFVVFNFTLNDIDAGSDIYVCPGTTQVTMAGDAGGLDYDEWTWTDNGAGGSFSTSYVGQDCQFYFYHPSCGFFCNVCTDIYDVTENSVYTIPATAQPGDIITISLVADSFFWCSDLESTMQIHILEDPEAEITSTDVTICEGDSTIITFSGTPGARIRYNDGSGDTNVNLNASGIYNLTVSPNITTTYTLNRVRYTNGAYPGGNNNCDVTLNESVTINVNTTPTVTAPNDITICEGDTIDLSTASLGGTNAIGTWSTSGTGTFGSGIYTPSASDIFNGSVTLTYTNTPSDGVCPPVSDTMVVTINQAASVYAGVDQTICSNETAIMSASLSGSATSGIWSGGTGTFSGNVPNATYTPGIGETGTITLTYTSNDPAGPCGSDSDTVNLTINPAATVNAGIDQTICSSETVDVSSASYGGSATTATWSTSGSGTFAGSIYTPSAFDISNGSVVLTYTTNNPAGVCGAVSDSITVFINAEPTVDAGTNQSICETDTTINLNASLGGGASSGTWLTSGNGTFNNNNPNAIYTIGSNDISNGSVTLTYTTNDPAGPCSAASDTVIYTIAPYLNASANNLTTISDCSDTTIQLQANGTGLWTVLSTPAGSSYSFSNVNDPNATFNGESGTTYDITWTLDNVSPCSDDTATLQVVFPNCGDLIDFDGTDDNINFANSYNLSGSFTVETWIKPNAINGSIQTILSKRDATNLATGYDLRLVNNTISFNANASSISANGITSNRWYHIAVTFNASEYRLYIDGILMNTTSGPQPTSNSFNTLIGAMSRVNNTPTHFYNGWLDEVRIWNTNLSAARIRFMMNQEIENNGGNVIGSVTGSTVNTGLNWSNLVAYYQMNQGTPDIAAGSLNADVGVNGLLRNITTLQSESAPLPYISNNNGNWNNTNTWLNGSVQQIPNTNGINGTPVNWNIVRTQHNVTSGNRETTVLGLLVDNNRYTINNNQSLRVTQYLKIDGILELEDESQLLQDTGSIVDYSGIGTLHRDQQGTTNLYNYNYWSSPVSLDGNTYRIGNVLYDGSNLVTWTTAHNATGGSPATLSSRWLYLYENYPFDSYDDWHAIDQNYSIGVGLGFTMKGSGNAGSLQNYTFVGKPNNGTITHTIGANNEALLGNPYPSAIDAIAVIADNSGVLLDGAIRFWEHAPSNNSHITVEYQGGYAYFNNLGGVSAISPPEINGVGDATKIPQRYIPVGQGFMVAANASGGSFEFNNNQRFFAKESNGNSIFIRSSNSENRDAEANNEENNNQLVRLNFISPENSIRPLLLGFTPDNVATDGVDYGYDALNDEVFPSDMSFIIEGGKYIIQGVGAFNSDNMYPLSIELNNGGNIEIELVDLENFDEDIDVFVYDALLGTYTRINTINYQNNLDAGIHNNRFFIAFQNESILNIDTNYLDNITVNYLNNSDEIYIKVPSGIEIKQVYLVNMLGQSIRSWNRTNTPLSQETKIPIRNISEGNYIIKVQTSDNRTVNKKIVIKQ